MGNVERSQGPQALPGPPGRIVQTPVGTQAAASSVPRTGTAAGSILYDGLCNAARRFCKNRRQSAAMEWQARRVRVPSTKAGGERPHRPRGGWPPQL